MIYAAVKLVKEEKVDVGAKNKNWKFDPSSPQPSPPIILQHKLIIQLIQKQKLNLF